MDTMAKGAVSGIRVTKKRDGFLMIAPNGSCDFMSFFEGLRYRFSRRLPKRAEELRGFAP